MANNIKHREPLMHIAKRDDLAGWKAWLIRLAAILIGFVISGIISTMLDRKSVV